MKWRSFIDHEARKFLKLSCNEYMVADFIYHFSKVDKSWCNVSKQLMSETFGISKVSILEIIKRLIADGLVLKHKSGNGLRTSKRWFDVSVCQNLEDLKVRGKESLPKNTGKESLPVGKESLPSVGKESLPNRLSFFTASNNLIKEENNLSSKEKKEEDFLIKISEQKEESNVTEEKKEKISTPGAAAAAVVLSEKDKFLIIIAEWLTENVNDWMNLKVQAKLEGLKRDDVIEQVELSINFWLGSRNFAETFRNDPITFFTSNFVNSVLRRPKVIYQKKAPDVKTIRTEQEVRNIINQRFGFYENKFNAGHIMRLQQNLTSTEFSERLNAMVEIFKKQIDNHPRTGLNI
jgi:hypothetical protein